MNSFAEPNDRELLAFGEFEFSSARLELRRGAEIVRLQQQPLKLLAALLRRPGELVTRDELRAEVWGEGIHLDFADALNHTIKYLRDALGDAAARPRFIETVPRRGYRFIAPVRRVMERPTDVPASLAPASAVELPSTASGRTQVGTWQIRPHVAAMLALVAAALALSVWKSAGATSAARVVNAVQLTHFGLANAVVSDGTRLYVDEAKAGIHRIVVFPADGAGPPTPLVTPFHDVQLLDISPDRKRLLVASRQGPATGYEVWELPLNGESPRSVGDIDSGSAKWSADGKKIAFAGSVGGTTGLYVADADGSNAHLLTRDVTYVESWSPDGTLIRFTRMNISGGLSMWQVRADGTNERLALPSPTIESARWGEGQCCGRWTKDGRYFLYEEASERTTRILAVRDHPLVGSAQKPIEIYSAAFQGSGIGSSLASGPDHQLLTIGWNEKRELARYDRTIGKFVPIFPEIEAREIALSPDGHWLAYTALPGLNLWKMELATGRRTQLTSGRGMIFGPVWSPDGTRIAVHVLFPGEPGKVEVIPASGGDARLLFAGEKSQEDSQTWSPDGRALLVGRAWLDDKGNTVAASYSFVDLKSGQASKVPESEQLGAASWSPDGRYIAAQSTDFRQLLLFDFKTARWKTVATGAMIWRPLWTHDGRSVLYQDARAGEEQPIYKLDVATGKSQQVTTRSEILEPNLSSYLLVGVSRDDMPIVTLVRRNSDVYALDVKLP